MNETGSTENGSMILIGTLIARAKRTLFATVAALIFSCTTHADTLAVIGTGQVGAALGTEFGALGHMIVYGSRDPSREEVAELVARSGKGARATTPAEAVRGADFVVLAVPGLLVTEVTRSLGDLSGKIIIDPTNALRRDEDGRFYMDVATSNAELIQSAAPKAHVVKAFNTINYRTMIDPDSSGGPVTVPLVGDDDDAKRRVAQLVGQLGLEAIDLGPLAHAKHVEGMLILWINARGQDGFDYHLRRVP